MVILPLWTMLLLCAGAGVIGACAERWYSVMRRRMSETELRRLVQSVQSDSDAELRVMRRRNLVLVSSRAEKGPYAR